MNNQFRLLLLLTAFFFSFRPSSGAEVKRIVSLAPSLTMNLYYLNAQDKLVGCTSYCEAAKKDHKAVVASAIKVNLEKVLSLRPDLVIATTITNPETIKSLRKLGLKVEVFPTATSFNTICAQFALLGKLIGKEKAAMAVISKSKLKVESLRKSIHLKNTPGVFFQIGSNPLYTVIPNTFMDDYIRFIGAKNIAHDLNKGSITREAVLVRNPDIIFIVTMGMAGAEEKKIWESYTELKATRNRQIYTIDSNLACTPTPVSFVQTLETIINLISHKK